MNITILFVAVVVVLAVSAVLDDGVPKVYRKRLCLGYLWRRRFPEISKQSIRQCLQLFTNSFAIWTERGLKFGPDDELMAIYRARYPSRGWPDALEFEALAEELEKKHHVSLQDIWHDRFTLGELLVHLQEPNKPLNARPRAKHAAH